MRIVHVVCSSAFAGVERSLTYVAPELARRGHDVTVIGGAPRCMAETLTAAGVAYTPAGGFIDAMRALRTVSAAPVDVVHSHMTEADLASVLSRPPVRPLRVSTLHFARPRGHTAIRRRLYRSLAAHIDVQIAISDYVATRCATPAIVVPNGLPNCDRLPVDRERVVLVAQRLEHEKQTHLAIEAWACCGLGQQGWELHIAGDGRDRPALAKRVAELGLADSVRLLGFVDDVHTRMARASIFLATAPGEPFGLGVVEAMAAGLPVVAAGGGGHLDTVGAATPSLLFECGDSRACAATLNQIASNDEERKALGERGRKFQHEQFSVAKHVDGLLEIYCASKKVDHRQSEAG